MEETRAPLVARRLVAPLGLQREQDLGRSRRVQCEGRTLTVQDHSQRRHALARGDFVAIVPGREPVWSRMRAIDRCIVRAEMDQRTQAEPDRRIALALNQPVGDMNRILKVRDQQPLFEGDSRGLMRQTGKPSSSRNSTSRPPCSTTGRPARPPGTSTTGLPCPSTTCSYS